MSYASDLRAAAEVERDAAARLALSMMPDTPWCATLHGVAVGHRIDLTTPDRLVPFLSYVEQLERVAEAARATDHIECENFPPGSTLDCTQEPPEGWGITINPCLFCELRALDREAR